MKRILMGFAALTLILTGCQKSEVTDTIQGDGALKFGLYQGTSTRAAEWTNENLKTEATGTPIPLYAYKGAQSGAKMLYFEEELTWDSPESDKWNTKMPRFLPQSDKLQFYAYYPTTGVTLYKHNLTANSYPTFRYTIQDNGTTTDLIAAAVNDHNGTNVIIPMRHILSQINFGVKGYYGAQIEIKNIRINQVFSAGTFTMDNTDASTWVWSSQDTEDDYDYIFPTFTTPGTYQPTPINESGYTYIFGDGGNWGPGFGVGKDNTWYVTTDNTSKQASTITAATPKLGNSLMLLPQELVTGMSAAYVTFDYRIRDLDGGSADNNGWIVGDKDGVNNNFEVGKFDLHFDEGVYAGQWNPNFRYVYVIDFTDFLDGQKLTFDVDVQLFPWENYNKEDGNNGIVYLSSLGEPIFNTSIKPLVNGGNYKLPKGNVFSDNVWDWSGYIMTNAFTANNTFTIDFTNVIFNGNSITVVPPVGFSVSNNGIVSTATTLTFTKLP